MVNWNYYDKKEFEDVNDEYLPYMGEGETMATQIVTAVNKLVYKWYNDGDVYDNTYGLSGWFNDLSSYANWLSENAGKKTARILDGIKNCSTAGDYEDLLKELADHLLDKELLKKYSELPAVGSIYDCDGRYKFEQYDEEEDDY